MVMKETETTSDPLSFQKPIATKENTNTATITWKKPYCQDLPTNIVTSNNFENISVVFDKFPGFIHIYIHSVENVTGQPNEQMIVSVCDGKKFMCSKKMEIKPFVKPHLFITLFIEDNKHIPSYLDISVRIYLPMDTFETTKVLATESIKLTSEILSQFQNKLCEQKLRLKASKSKLQYLMPCFAKEQVVKDYPCRCYISYQSQNDNQVFNIKPKSLVSLCQWVIFRRLAFDKLFEGYVNIKSEKYNFNWNKRYIRWYGYIIFVLNETKDKVETKINLSLPEISLEIMQNKVVQLNMPKSVVELQCFEVDTFKSMVKVLYTLFPQIYNFV